jgi:Ca2+-transporting ATPase
MILSDDNFATIVYAVEQGRKLYDNLNKYIRFVLIMLVAFVLTFLGATLVNIADGQPFTPGQVLWIHFLLSAAFGIALGFDEETPGLMRLAPRPRGESLLTPAVKMTSGLVGLFIAVASLAIIEIGIHAYDSTLVGTSIAFTGFALMLIVAAFESRSETDTIFTMDTFNSRKMNMIAAAEILGAILVTQWDFLRRILGTTELTAQQWGLGLLSALLLLGAWEAAKWIARRQMTTVARGGTAPAGA